MWTELLSVWVLLIVMIFEVILIFIVNYHLNLLSSRVSMIISFNKRLILIEKRVLQQFRIDICTKCPALQNRLACLSLERIFQASLTFVVIATRLPLTTAAMGDAHSAYSA
jgi:hypothetical protein